jgi:hypothetical protein
LGLGLPKERHVIAKEGRIQVLVGPERGTTAYYTGENYQ